jgi:hypothetical protein
MTTELPLPPANQSMVMLEKFEYDALQAEVKALRDDALRYRWLKANHLQTSPDSWIRTGDDLDDATEEALQRAGGKEGS